MYPETIICDRGFWRVNHAPCTGKIVKQLAIRYFFQQLGFPRFAQYTAGCYHLEYAHIGQQNNIYILFYHFDFCVCEPWIPSALFLSTVISCAFSKDSTNCFMNASASSMEDGIVVVSLSFPHSPLLLLPAGMSSHHNRIRSHSATSLP